jgi:multidrug efflux pump subunit AcrA (membrane-fusion protein)
MRLSPRLIPLIALGISLCSVAEDRVISSLGRLEPENGVVQLAGPSGGGLTGSVMKSLAVAEGDWVENNQIVAHLDSYNLRKAEVGRLEAILTNARSEIARQADLSKRSLTSAARYSKFMPTPVSGLGHRASWNSAVPIACTQLQKSMKPTLPR